MNSLKILFILLFFGAALHGIDLQELERFIEKSRKELGVPGASVSVVRGDEILFAKGFGLIKEGSPEKVDEETIFQLASVTKTFTSAALAIQVDKGVLGWDDEVMRHLPRFALNDPYPSRFATPRDLLAHRTGLPAFGGDLLGKIGYSPSEILSRIRLIEPAASFRERPYYSNICYFTAGELIGKLAESDWENVVEKAFLEPLKMTRSGFAANLDEDNVAYPHANIDDTLQVLSWDRTGGFPAAGAMTSTAKDMAHWMILHLNKGTFENRQILKPETVKQMHLPSMVSEVDFSEMPPISDTSGFAFGLGWGNYHYEGRMIVEKGGGLDGIRTIVTLVPELNIGITVLSNLNLTVFPELIRAKFLQLALNQDDPQMFDEILARQKKLDELIKKPAPPEDALPLGHDLSSYEGSFANELYGTFIVSEKEGGLVLEAGPDHWEGVLEHWSNNTFVLSWPVINQGNEHVTFTFGPEGKAQEMSTETLGVFTKE